MGTGYFDGATVRQFAVGDLLAILAFVVVGEYHHNVDPVVAPAAVAGTLLPFLLGWAVVGPLAGVYGRSVRESSRSLAGRTLAGWLLAVALAMGLRTTDAFRGDAAVTFYLVAAVAGGGLLLLWRFAAVAALRRYRAV